MNMVDPRLELAIKYHDFGRAAAAIDVLTELLAENPEEAIYHALLASCLLAENRFVAAEYEIGIALGQDPNLPFVHEVRARFLFLQNKMGEAIEACDESLRLDPESATCHLIKAKIQRVLEKNDEALGSLREAAALEPDNIQVAIAYGEHYNSIGEYGKALEHARDALRLNAGDLGANVLMGETQLALGNTAEAEYHAKFAITQDPNSKDALHLFADIKMRRNWFMGIWWRFNMWAATLGNMRAALVLISGFLGFNILSEIADDLGYAGAATFLSSAWLILVVYSWVGIPMYHKAIAKELEKFTFNPKF